MRKRINTVSFTATRATKKVVDVRFGYRVQPSVIAVRAILPEIKMEPEAFRLVGLEKKLHEMKKDAKTVEKGVHELEKELDKLEKPILLKLRDPIQPNGAPMR
jgi:hypothetical protein